MRPNRFLKLASSRSPPGGVAPARRWTNRFSPINSVRNQGTPGMAANAFVKSLINGHSEGQANASISTKAVNSPADNANTDLDVPCCRICGDIATGKDSPGRNLEIET